MLFGRNLWKRFAIMAPEGGGEGDGGGGAAPAEGFSEAQLAILDKKINGAISGHGNRISAALDKKIGEMGEGLTAKVSSMFDEFRGTPKDKPDDKGGGGDDVAAKIQAEADAKIAALTKQFESEKKAREEERAANIRNNERSRLAAALGTAGVDAGRARSAVALLHTEDQRVGTDKDGNVVIKFQREGWVEELPVEKGVAEWLATPEGKHYAPARPAAGSGAEGGARPGDKGGGKMSRQEALNEIAKMMITGG